ncbi:MAG TPA: trypsin-like peptidase domain-containing protein [Spirochaetota bacterium]|nr:trypsin-like peptidase domain-containing protein [Spirochaetota bacterium]
MRKYRLPAIMIGAAIAAGALNAEPFPGESGRESPLKKQNQNSPVYELQKTFQNIYEQYKNSVVFISTEKTVKTARRDPFMDDPFFREFFGRRPQVPDTQKRRGLGTGFIISESGYICTNHHVVATMDSVTVRVNNKDYTATLVGSDQLTDIALLKINGSGKFTPVYFGNSDSVKVGDMAIAIGNPFGLDKTITTGVISATGRHVYNDMGISHIQTDASINPGNSGGPLINIYGEVIGVNRMIYSSTGGSLGIGFAIPINTARDTLIQLQKYGKVKRGYIGVQISPLTAEFARELGLQKPEGALVGAVEKDGPAEKAGLRIRDVITRIEGKAIRDFNDLLGIVSRSEIGRNIQLTVWRDKSEINMRVTVKERP